ncbi:putative disease resistance protein At3g14460 [Amaranthus tricolor]|uniref:putative disease resistance protein At3g14460 n=1 Tax=Amaranthus tricolor TaxID=29722 RepID=UPI00258E268E|nr:putative disease resistance protein At3g14460 [Amaranthus tricolor]
MEFSKLEAPFAIFKSILGGYLGMDRWPKGRNKKLLQGTAKSSSNFSSAKTVYQIVVDTVNKLGGIKKVTYEAILDELKGYEGLNLLDVYKYIEMLQDSTNLEGNKISIPKMEGTSEKQPSETKHSGVLFQESSTSNSDIVMPKLFDLALLPQAVFLTVKHLEVLDLSKTNISELPSSLGNLIELRYLNLSNTQIELLPETLNCLIKLETLKLNDCTRLWKLPEGTNKLTSLKHLELDVLRQITYMPKGIGKLTKLETLSAFLVQNCTNGVSSIIELRDLNNLKGNLCVSRLENVLHPFHVEEASLSRKKYIKELELRWSDDYHQSGDDDNNEVIILGELRPNYNLEKLKISCYNGKIFPSWIGDSRFKMLTSITLFKCTNCEILPCLGQLPSLKYLSLVEMDSLIEIRAKFRGFGNSVAFPKLERLSITGFCQLVYWEEAKKGDYPCLNKLIIERCQKLETIPCTILQLNTLKHLEVIKCSAMSTLFLEGDLLIALRSLIIEECPLVTDWFRKCKGKDRRRNIENLWIDQERLFNN